MIEFVLKNRRLRLYPDGTMTRRALNSKGIETKKEIWIEIKFSRHSAGYLKCGLSVEGVERNFYKHRLLHLARNPDWDIFDASINNCIDHINHTRDDNTTENLRVVTKQQNQFNRSGVKGYTWSKQANKWAAKIYSGGKSVHIGFFEKEEDAHAAYLETKERLHVIPEN